MKFDAYEELQRASLSQFRNKPITNGIQKAIADTLQSVYEESQQLRSLGDIEKMNGRNLDVIGDRLGLSRSDAYKILLNSQSVEITDEIYRKCLRWKQFKNNFTGTYAEIMESIRILWKTDNIIYRELPEHPAHVFISMPLYNIDIKDPWLGKALVLKPDGVSMTFTSDYLSQIVESKIETIRAPAMRLYMKIYWSKVYNFDGTLEFDGKQTFFGWVYSLPVSMANVAAKIMVNEDIIAEHNIFIEVPIMEEIEGANFFVYLGEVSSPEGFNSKIDYQTYFDSEVESFIGNKIIYSHNPGFFDGQYIFNGERNFDAYYKEEDF